MSESTAPETPTNPAQTVRTLCVATGLAVLALAVLHIVWPIATNDHAAASDHLGGGDIARSLLAAVLYLFLGLIIAVQSGVVARDPGGPGTWRMRGLAVFLVALLVADAVATYFQAWRLKDIEQIHIVDFDEVASSTSAVGSWAAAFGFGITIVAALALLTVVQFGALKATDQSPQGDTRR